MLVQPQETQLWSIANIGADISYMLHLIPVDGDDSSVTVYLFSVDGILRNQLIPLNEHYLLGPANRVQLLVQFPAQANKKFELITEKWSSGSQGDLYPKSTLMTVKTKGTVQAKITPPTVFPAAIDYRKSNITANRTFYFSETSDGDTFFIDGLEFNSSRVDTTVVLGSIERWTILNLSQEAHFFHIHQGFFQVVTFNGTAMPFTGHQDTVLLPYAEDEQHPTSVELIIPFNDPLQVGKYVYREFSKNDPFSYDEN